MSRTAPIAFYTANTPNGQKISIFLEEAGIAYDAHHFDLGKGQQHSEAFMKISPNGKIPAIVDTERDISVFESAAILRYLSNRFSFLKPKTALDELAVEQWLFFQIGSLGPMLGQLWWFLHGSKTGNEEAIARYRKEALRLYGVVDRRLAKSRYLATHEYSIADIAAFTWLRTHDELQLDICEFTHVSKWLAIIEAREAVQRGLALS